MEPHREPRNKFMRIWYGKLIFTKGVKATYGEKNTLFNKWCWETVFQHVKIEKKLYSYLRPHTISN